jgi:transposase
MRRLTHEEIKQIYNAGPEKVVELVDKLFDVIEKLSEQVQEQAIVIQIQQQQIQTQQHQIQELQSRVKTLEERLNKNSRNSHKPPSTDVFVKPKSQRKKGEKPNGGQKGHQGYTLEMVENPTHVIVHKTSHCENCGCSLQDTPGVLHQKRQEFDIPPLRIEVTEHQTQKTICGCCGHKNIAEFPEHITQPVQYGNNIKSLTVYLNQYQFLPFDRTTEFFLDLFGHPLSQATLMNSNHECYEKLENAETKIKNMIINSPVVNFDETGLRIEGSRQWLHSASTKELTYYSTHPKRGDEGMIDAGILPNYSGRAISDHWKPYFTFDCEHGLCNAHHIRELTAIYESENQEWAKEFIDLLLDIKDTVDKRKIFANCLKPFEIKAYEERYNSLIEKGYQENPPPLKEPGKRGRIKQSKARNLLDRFYEHKHEVLAFIYDFRVPFDNNQAERDIRMVKVQQKISGTFRSALGAKIFCRIRGYISTVRKNGFSVFEAIRNAFSGNPFLPEEMIAINSKVQKLG